MPTVISARSYGRCVCRLCLRNIYFIPLETSRSHLIYAIRYPTPSEIIDIAKAGPIIVSSSPIKSYAIPTLTFHYCGTSPRYFNSVGASLEGQIFVLGSVCLCTIAISVPGILSTFFKTLGGLRVFKFLWERCIKQGVWQPKRTFTSSIQSLLVLYIVIGLAGMAYILSRLFVIAEIFRVLFYLLSRAFETASWVIALPHAG